MSTIACTTRSEAMRWGNQVIPHSGLVSGYESQLPKPETFLARKNLRELLESIGKNPKLVDQLASKKSRNERIDLLINHKLMASNNDLPTGEEIKQKKKYLFADCEHREQPFEDPKSALAFIVAYGGYSE